MPIDYIILVRLFVLTGLCAILALPATAEAARKQPTGSGLKGRELDIYMPSCRKARAFGRRTVQVEIVRRPSLR